MSTVRGVGVAGGVAIERNVADGRVGAAGGVGEEGECSTGGVKSALCVAIKRVNTNRRIAVCSIGKECSSAKGCV